ncbi:hypothetical protein HMPREF9547_01374, partial [Escherichia coli MS 175-1]
TKSVSWHHYPLTYGGYEMTPVKVTINAVAAETENGEEEMP